MRMEQKNVKEQAKRVCTMNKAVFLRLFIQILLTDELQKASTNKGATAQPCPVEPLSPWSTQTQALCYLPRINCCDCSFTPAKPGPNTLLSFQQVDVQAALPYPLPKD